MQPIFLFMYCAVEGEGLPGSFEHSKVMSMMLSLCATWMAGGYHAGQMGIKFVILCAGLTWHSWDHSFRQPPEGCEHARPP